FDGNITIEVRGTSFPVKLYSGQRFVHIVFSKLTTPLEKPYSGKYQGQKGVTLPIFSDQVKN
ncbi:dCTP deaminase, partial [Candidatus Marsarchaeota G2 archaeon BE_D]